MAEVSLFLTDDQIQLIQQTWLPIESGDLTEHGLVMFRWYFSQYPDLKELFVHVKDLPNEKIHESELMCKHVRTVLRTFGVVVSALDDAVPNVVPILKKLGARHANFRVKPEFFPATCNSLIHMLKEANGNRFTDADEKAWRKFYDFFTHHMSQALQTEYEKRGETVT